MTGSFSVPESNEPSHPVFRVATLLFAVLLGAQCVWLLLAELSRPNVDGIPTDTSAAAMAAKQSDPASWAAKIGTIRGDLWAEDAFTYASLILGDPKTAAGAGASEELARAHASIDRALDDAPHLSDAWLFLAGLAAGNPSLGIDPTGALKMSYYTGPSEHGLIPLRFRLAAQAGSFGDVEINQFVSRDLQFLLTQKQTSAIETAYSAASPAGKQFIETALGGTNPAELQKLKANNRQNLLFPN